MRDELKNAASRTPSSPPSGATVGIVFILVSSVLLAPASQTATKFLAQDFPILQVIWVRSVGHMAWMVGFFWRDEGLRLFRSTRPGLQLLRSTLLFVSSICWVSAIAFVPLTTASAIGFTAPIMVVLLSIPLLGERVGLHRWAAVVTGFGGALLIIRPGSAEVPPELGLLVLAAFLFALYQILTRRLASSDSAATTSTYTIAVALVATSCVVPLDFQMPAPGAWAVWVAVFATGLFGGFRHYFVVKAYEHAPASVISPFFYSELIGTTALGFLIFGDLPDSWTVAGALVIIASGLYIAHREALVARRRRRV